VTTYNDYNIRGKTTIKLPGQKYKELKKKIRLTHKSILDIQKM